MIDLQERVKGLLACNTSWNMGCPYITGNFEEDSKAWDVAKIIMERRIVKDLKALFEKDESIFQEAMMKISRELTVAKWQSKGAKGTFKVWSMIFYPAKNAAIKTVTGKGDIDNLAKGLLKHGTKEHAGRFIGRRRISKPSA